MTAERIKEIEKTTGYPDSVSIQQALFQVWNEVARENKQSQPLTDKEFETLSTRITPSLYDVVLDGVDESKTDLLRKLRMIIDDIITTRQRRNYDSRTEKRFCKVVNWI